MPAGVEKIVKALKKKGMSEKRAYAIAWTAYKKKRKKNKK